MHIILDRRAKHRFLSKLQGNKINNPDVSISKPPQVAEANKNSQPIRLLLTIKISRKTNKEKICNIDQIPLERQNS